MEIKFDTAFKNRGDVAVIVVGAIVIAIPIFIFGSIRALSGQLSGTISHLWRGQESPLFRKKLGDWRSPPKYVLLVRARQTKIAVP